jgi:hypothetical protein
MVEILPKERLVAAIRTTTKPVSFLVGAPIAWDGTRGVPPVRGTIAIIRQEIESRDPPSLPVFDAQIGPGTGPDAYQKAMSFLLSSFDPEVVGEVVKQAVLTARRPGAPAFDSGAVGEGSRDDWNIPPGIDGMARLIRTSPEKFAGPILTTNFDPLIFLSLESFGLRPRPCVVPMDGSVATARRNHAEEIDIVHLHGYWRDSPTLHTPAQLTLERPQLQQSLQRLLRQRTLVVIAYGGWDDAISTALARCLDDAQFEGSVRWCFYGDSEAALRAGNAALFQKFAGGINTGRIQFYRGIDCHSIFPELLVAVGAAPNVLAATAASPLAGWELITPEYLASLAPLTSEEAIRYFDGAIPTWRHVVSNLIPRLSHVAELCARIDGPKTGRGAPLLQLLRAAGGKENRQP